MSSVQYASLHESIPASLYICLRCLFRFSVRGRARDKYTSYSLPVVQCSVFCVLCSLVALPPMNRLGLETNPFGNAVILPAFSSFVGLHKAITHMQDGVNDKTRCGMFSRITSQKSVAGVTTRCDFSNMQPSQLATAPALDIF